VGIEIVPGFSEVSDQPPPPPRAERRRSGRLLSWFGGLLIVIGLVCLGYVAWELYGTSYVAKKEQASVVAEVEKAWDKRDGTQVKSKGAVVSALVRIPKFGSDYAVPLLEGTTDAVLTGGYGHFLDSADPGKKGNFAVAAHRITHGEPLRRMPELQPGDEIIIETPTMVYTYVLDTGGDDLTVDFTAGWVVGELPDNPKKGGIEPAQVEGQRLITLTTCAELFHTDNRLIAFGHLVDKGPRE
jgi:sortase A